MAIVINEGKVQLYLWIFVNWNNGWWDNEKELSLMSTKVGSETRWKMEQLKIFNSHEIKLFSIIT